MKITILKSSLVQLLQVVAKAIPTKTTKPILYGVLLQATEEKLIVTAYDLEIGIQTHLAEDESQEPILQIERVGSVVLNAKYLLGIVRKLPHRLVRIDVDGMTATIRSGKATYTLNGMDSREYPELPDIEEDKKMTVSSETFLSLIEQTAFATATTEIRPVLTGVLMSTPSDRLQFTASDSHRLSTHNLPFESVSAENIEAIIPRKSIFELAKLLGSNDQMIDVFVTDQHFFADLGTTIFYSRLVDGKYPDISRIIPTQYETAVEVDAREFAASIERSALLARDDENQVIRMSISQEHIDVSSHSLNIGKVKESFYPSKMEGEPLDIASNAHFLLDALKALGSSKVRIEFTSSGSAFTLTTVGQDRPLHLISPVRVV